MRTPSMSLVSRFPRRGPAISVLLEAPGGSKPGWR
jgi:hypothetical protein